MDIVPVVDQTQSTTFHGIMAQREEGGKEARRSEEGRRHKMRHPDTEDFYVS